MIAGPPGRRFPRDISRSLQPAFEQLHLPWLCPSIHSRAQSPSRPQFQRRATATTAHRRPNAPMQSRTSPVTTSHGSNRGRSYAYAASPSTQKVVDDPYVPIVRENPFVSSSWTDRLPLIPLFDPSNPLIVEEKQEPMEDVFRDPSLGWGAEDLARVYQNLEACLATRLFERAAATMRYLNGAYRSDRPEVLKANNVFISHLHAQLMTTSDPDIVQLAQKWYHVEMLKKDIRPDAATYALLIQIVMHDEIRTRAARSVRRYTQFARDDGMFEEVREKLGNVMPASEYRQLAEMAPDSFNAFEEITEKMEMKDQEKEVQARPIDMEWTASLPKVAAVDQKGEGLRALRQSLATLSTAGSLSSNKDSTSDEEVNRLRQSQLEDDTLLSALQRWRADREATARRGGVDGSLQAPELKELIWRWHEQLVPLLRDEVGRWAQERVSVSKHGAGTMTYEPYFRFISPERISVIAIVTTLNAMATSRSKQLSVSVTQVVTAIARNVEMESKKEWAKIRRKNRFSDSGETQGDMHEAAVTSAGTQFTSKETISTSVKPPEWQLEARVQVGAAILSQLLKIAKLPPSNGAETGTAESKERFAFVRNTSFSKGRRLGVVTFDTELVKLMSREPGTGTITKFLPMLSKPKPWTGLEEGGYLQDGCAAVRFPTYSFQAKSYVRIAVQNGDMKQMLRAVDVLGQVPWKINRDVFEVMLEVWNTGKAFAKIPAANPVVDIPEPPSPNATAQEKIKYAISKRNAQHEIAGLHSERCFQNMQLEVARAYLDETFYLPHNLDFRGRAYPLPPYLNQMGADNARGLLIFGDGKELGQKGLEWLKVHLANLYGYDKASLSERRAFTDEHLGDVFDSAKNPLEGRRWWLQAEDPWQCLATCFELSNALNLPDPTKFVSHLPVHQDGTCNGLQHYAALGGDEAGAKQVNLEPGDRPSDIYTSVAELVRSYVMQDAASGLKIAKLLEDKIVRKVVKQTVMTNVYGVTFQGARLQVVRQLEDLYPETFPRQNLETFLAATYIAKQIFKAMSTIFNGASAIQRWLGECASRICQSVTPEQLQKLKECEDQSSGDLPTQPVIKRRGGNKPDTILENSRFKSTVIWTTPMRMPVVQPYRSAPSKKIKTNLQQVSIQAPTASDAVSKRKQLQAFPPNFIHSLDATHMLLSALKCEEQGLSFAAVHDSFWTHAADIDKMNTALRDAFVLMHSEDIVGRLATEFQARYKDCMHMSYIHKKSPLGRKISKLRKGARNAKIPELLAEKERLELLASEDSEIRARGQAMVTPGSLYAQANPEDFLEPQKLRKSAVEKPTAAETILKTNLDAESVEKIGDSFGEDWTASPESMNGDSVVFETPDGEWSANMPVDEGHCTEASLPEKSVKGHDKLWLWLPLVFPPIPKKGSWEVKRLKESKYFFS